MFGGLSVRGFIIVVLLLSLLIGATATVLAQDEKIVDAGLYTINVQEHDGYFIVTPVSTPDINNWVQMVPVSYNIADGETVYSDFTIWRGPIYPLQDKLIEYQTWSMEGAQISSYFWDNADSGWGEEIKIHLQQPVAVYSLSGQRCFGENEIEGTGFTFKPPLPVM